MSYVKCPVCDLNYMQDTETMCDSCKPTKTTISPTQIAPTPSIIDESVMLIRINKTYSPTMTKQDLYDVTRGVWKVGDRRNAPNYAFAVFQGYVKEVYKISIGKEPLNATHI